MLRMYSAPRLVAYIPEIKVVRAGAQIGADVENATARVSMTLIRPTRTAEIFATMRHSGRVHGG